MIKIIKFLSFLLVVVTAFAEAKVDLEKYRLYVTQADPASHSFTLSNQMVCYIPPKKGEGSLPPLGVEIHLMPRLRHSDNRNVLMEEGDFLASYAEGLQLKQIDVWISPESEQYCLVYLSSELVCIQEGGWFFPPVMREVFELSDGSKWIAQNKGPFKLREGDRVLITKLDGRRWGMTNVDRSHFFENMNGSGKTFAQYVGVFVYPYLLEEVNP